MKNRVIVNLNTCRLAYYEGDLPVREYAVGIGKMATPTPAGHYRVVEKLIFEEPPAAGPDFGSRRLVLSSDRTCLHGSWNGPVEGPVSCGCIRMYNRDIEELFAKVEVGTIVEMI